MEDENTLLGFEAVSDIFDDSKPFTEPTNDGDEISDEELEELKNNSKNSRPVTPGAQEQFVEDNNEPDEQDEPEDYDDDESEDGDDLNQTQYVEDTEESGQVTALFDAIAEKLNWEFEDDEERPHTAEELVDYFSEAIAQNSVPEYASEETRQIDEFVRNGGNLRDYFSVDQDIDYDNFDTTNENNQKQIVRQLLTEQGYNDKQIQRKLEKYEDAGILEDEAEDALDTMRELNAAKKEQLLADQETARKDYEARQQAYIDNVVNEIKSMDDIRGIHIPEKDKRELLNYIFRVGSDGKTQYQKDYQKSVRNLVESAYFTMKGDILLDSAKKMGNSTAIKNLKQSLRSTGVSKGTRRINTTSSNSIFSRAVKLL